MRGAAWSNIQSSKSVKGSEHQWMQRCRHPVALREPWEDPIGAGDRVSLQYKGKQLFVIVISVVAPQERYEGRVQGFVDPQQLLLEFAGLKVSSIVGCCHDDIWSVE
jgi:hypothetical protein